MRWAGPCWAARLLRMPRPAAGSRRAQHGGQGSTGRARCRHPTSLLTLLTALLTALLLLLALVTAAAAAAAILLLLILLFVIAAAAAGLVQVERPRRLRAHQRQPAAAGA